MKEILISIKRSPYQSLAISLILFFTTTLSISLFIILSFIYSFLNYVETRPQVIVYFRNTTSQEDIFKIRDELKNSGKILSIKYTSKEEAFKIYKELNKDNPLLLEMVSPETLPASLEIYAQKPIFLPEIAEFLKKQTGVDEVIFQKDTVNRLIQLTNFLRISSLIFFTFLIFMTIIILLVIFSFKIALKKEEIHLLQLLGATKNYIRLPFLKEAFFYGMLTSCVSFLIILSLVLYFKPFLTSYLFGINNLSFSFILPSFSLIVWPVNFVFMFLTFLLSFIFSTSIVTIASFLAVEKYLK